MLSRIFCWACLVALCALLTACGGADYEGDQRFPLSGTASYDGKPIDLGAITLVPNGGGAKSPSGGVIQDGKYMIAEPMGPNAGSYRVEIQWLKLTGKQLLDSTTGEMYGERKQALPVKFNTKSELTIEVPAAANKADFDLNSH